MEAWEAVCAGAVVADPLVADRLRGDPRPLAASWRDAARSSDPVAGWQAHVDLGVEVVGPGEPGWPTAFDDDPEPPAVLFARGALEATRGPSVAVVGTRRCTRYGHDLGRQLGRELSAAGVSIVSGLALGIDEAAHRGALEADAAPPVAVVGTGLDVPYPRRNAGLWAEVAEVGVVVSEAPLGTSADAWRFPARNRLIAALADVTVVVESHERGGSLYTAEEAVARDRPVLAVPGPIRSPASLGTNRLLADGAEPLCEIADVIVALGLVGAFPAAGAGEGGLGPDAPARPRPGIDGRAVLDALGWEAGSLDDLLGATDLDLGPLSLALDRLEAEGWVSRRGAWYQQVAER